MSRGQLRLGVDLGGTKIAVTILDAHGAAIYSSANATPQGDYPLTLEAIAAAIQQAEAHVGKPCSLGIGTPGSKCPKTGVMRNCNSTCLNGEHLQEDLERVLGRSIKLANDANCFALSEASDGAAAGYETVFGVILGTGIGAGIVRSGKLLEGHNGVAGEWGHNSLPLSELPGNSRGCYCGKQDCVEAWVSGPGLLRTYHELAPGHEHGALRLPAALPVNVEQIVALSRQGEALATAVLGQHLEILAASLSVVVNILDPDIIVLGGGLGQLDNLPGKLAVNLKDRVFGGYFDTPIVQPQHGPASGVRGAANLWA